jgi:hypothetical protein
MITRMMRQLIQMQAQQDGWLLIYKNKGQADGGAIEGDCLYAILDRKEKRDCGK